MSNLLGDVLPARSQVAHLRAAAAVPSPMADVLALAGDMARNANENVLILGETGTGKEWLAEWMHRASRRTGPFVPVNTCSLPVELFEAELMGTVHGAFTGANERIGWAEAARGGTLFLDEIGDLDLRCQAKLLRFLDDRIATPLGSTRRILTDVFVIAATNASLETLDTARRFRRDLLYRFGLPLEVPPLRNRRDEIHGIATASLASIAPGSVLDAQAMGVLQAFDWPGNVRQLKNVLRRASSLSRGGVIDRNAVSSLLREPKGACATSVPGLWVDFSLLQMERERAWLSERLHASGYNVEACSRAMDYPATSLRRLLRRHGLFPLGQS